MPAARPARRPAPRGATREPARRAKRERKTKETQIAVRFDLDGSGKHDVSTGLPFLDHMLELVAVHGLFDLTVKATGDIDVDQHHTVEDLGLVLGAAIDDALGDRKGLVRYASLEIPMDECLVSVALDLGGRPFFASDLKPKTRIVGSFDSTLVPDFFVALTQGAKCTLHIRQLAGGNTHHLLEATFKAFGRALDAATQRDPRRRGVPSSKGTLG
jgi:imidazoleglycerol-phosphate dehydratase